MDLIEKIKKIAEAEGIDERELILDEAEFFIGEHKEHPTLEIRLKYSSKNGRLECIKLECYNEVYSLTIYERGKIIPIDIKQRK